MYQNLKKHACWKCNFSTSRKFNLDRHFKRKHQDQHHQSVQVQQAGVQQHGGRVQVLHQQHDRIGEQVNNQSDYKHIKLIDLNLLKTCGNIEYLLKNIDHFLGCFHWMDCPRFQQHFQRL